VPLLMGRAWQQTPVGAAGGTPLPPPPMARVGPFQADLHVLAAGRTMARPASSRLSNRSCDCHRRISPSCWAIGTRSNSVPFVEGIALPHHSGWDPIEPERSGWPVPHNSEPVAHGFSGRSSPQTPTNLAQIQWQNGFCPRGNWACRSQSPFRPW